MVCNHKTAYRCLLVFVLLFLHHRPALGFLKTGPDGPDLLTSTCSQRHHQSSSPQELNRLTVADCFTSSLCSPQGLLVSPGVSSSTSRSSRAPPSSLAPLSPQRARLSPTAVGLQPNLNPVPALVCIKQGSILVEIQETDLEISPFEFCNH